MIPVENAVSQQKAVEEQFTERLRAEQDKVRDREASIEKVKLELREMTHRMDKLRDEKEALQKAIDSLTKGVTSSEDGATAASVLSGPAAAAVTALTDARKHMADAKAEMKEKEMQFKAEVERMKAELISKADAIESLSREIHDEKAATQAEKIRGDGIKHAADVSERESKTIHNRLTEDLHELRQQLEMKREEHADVLKEKENLDRELHRKSLELESIQKELHDEKKNHEAHKRENETKMKALREDNLSRIDEVNRHHEMVKTEMADQIQAYVMDLESIIDGNEIYLSKIQSIF